MNHIHFFRWIPIIATILSGVQINAQTYHPMPVSDAQWDISRCWYFYPGGWHDEYSVQMDGSDTTLNDRVYKKLNIVTHHVPGTPFDSVYTHFLGGMRETNKQVFFFSEYLCLDTIARMLYDFNDVQEGDTIYTQVLTNGLTQFIPHIVTSIETVFVGGEYHRSINLRDENDFFTESWIEGVGSTLGLIYPGYWLLTDNSYDLNCFYNQNELNFTNPNPMYLFCTPPLPDIECDTLTSIPRDIRNNDFRIYPNPTLDVLNIESENSFHSIQIINGLGKRIMSSGFTDEIDVSLLPPGFYLLQINGIRNQILATIKLVKI